MTGFDYLRIRGLDTVSDGIDPGLYEIFQGLGFTSYDETTPETPISSDSDLADLIWQGQNEKLEAENDYCDQLQKQFKQKQQTISKKRDAILDIVENMVEELAGKGVSVIVTGLTENPVAGAIAGLVTEMVVEWTWDYLANLLTRGNELLDGIKAENELLLQLEKSRENYEYREQVLARHREDIKLVLEQISSAEQNIQLDKYLEMAGVIENLIALQYNNEELHFPDGVNLSLRGRYHGG